jgi:hypothetical protein
MWALRRLWRHRLPALPFPPQSRASVLESRSSGLWALSRHSLLEARLQPLSSKSSAFPSSLRPLPEPFPAFSNWRAKFTTISRQEAQIPCWAGSTIYSTFFLSKLWNIWWTMYRNNPLAADTITEDGTGSRRLYEFLLFVWPGLSRFSIDPTGKQKRGSISLLLCSLSSDS